MTILGHYSDIHSILAGRIGGDRDAQSIIDDNGHYTDIHSILAGRIGGGREVQSIIDDNGHNTDIHSIAAGRVSGGNRISVEDHYNRFDVELVHEDQPATAGQAQGGGDPAVSQRGYEGLDPSVLATLRQPQRPHDYVGLGAGAAVSTQQTAEEIEMTDLDGGNDNQNTVSRQL